MDRDLFARVRQRLLDGTLWPLTDGRVLGSNGTGQPCAVCDETITGAESEYEVGGPVMIVRVHVACLSGVERRESALRLTSRPRHPAVGHLLSSTG
jgi:hypothetical protein